MSTLIDRFIKQLDSSLRTIFPPSQRISARTSPAIGQPEPKLSMSERKHIAGLMRVNHSGEVCAQALYQGQALTANLEQVRLQMNAAANDEIDHLAWCEQRLNELGSMPSVLNLFWYSGSLLLGALAGLAGDKISLGFVAETERQVTAHLQKHLAQVATKDQKSYTILQQMAEDESKHAAEAMEAGGIKLPQPIKLLMSIISKIMTKSSYYL